MAITQSDIDTIDAALAAGVRRVTFADGRTTEYHSADQMLAVRREFVAQLNKAANAAAGRPRKRYAVYGSGF